MRTKIRPSLVIAFLLFPWFLFSNNSVPTLKEQLQSLNACWAEQGELVDGLEQRILFETDTERIQMHLQLVEQALRDKNSSELTIAQREKRSTALDILGDYRLKGVFPINLYHNERTPYFIDDLGTACAVGHLIRETGFEALANEIHKNNNFDYIQDLKVEYEELGQWAKAFGFTMDELALIQPGYVNCATTCDYTLTIEPIVGTAPFSYHWAHLAEPLDTPFLSGLCPGETYEFFVEDANGILAEGEASVYINGDTSTQFLANEIEIPLSGTIIEETTTNAGGGLCTGSASLALQSDQPALFIQWRREGTLVASGPETSLSNLCTGNYEVTVVNNQCINEHTFSILDGPAANDEPENALAVSCGDALVGSNLFATEGSTVLLDACSDGFIPPGVWYRHDASFETLNINVAFFDEDLFPLIHVFTLPDGGDFSTLTCSDQNENGNLDNAIGLSGNFEGNTIYIHVSSYQFATAGGEFLLTLECNGCTNDIACNYEPNAQIESGNCDFATCRGCTYEDASNYDATARIDDGTCVYSEDPFCPLDVTNDDKVGIDDLLAIVSNIGLDCAAE